MLHSSSESIGIDSFFKRPYGMAFFAGNKMTLVEFKTLLQSQRLLELRRALAVVAIVCEWEVFGGGSPELPAARMT